MIIHFNIYNSKIGNFEANPKLMAQKPDCEVVKSRIYLRMNLANAFCEQKVM